MLRNKKDLKPLYTIWDNELNSFKENLSYSIHSSIQGNAYSELNKELEKLKKYCKNYKKYSNKNELNNLLTFISSLNSCYYDETERNLKFCLFEITELIKDNLYETNKIEDIKTLPEGYKKLITSMDKEVKN